MRDDARGTGVDGESVGDCAVAGRREGGGGGKRFAFAHGTFVGHVLAGEERFAVELTSDGEVYYEAYTFSRPAHALSVLGYPVVRLLQKKFHRDSTRAMKRILGESE